MGPERRVLDDRRWRAQAGRRTQSRAGGLDGVRPDPTRFWEQLAHLTPKGRREIHRELLTEVLDRS
ncbi:MAG TPA: hypothetical protein VMU14_21200 [Acidimicrobiales bacterium]|nr:hypothetical protein [Acidimicrobiales bacterium]